MIRDFVLEVCTAPGSGATVTLPGAAPAGRRTWASAFVTSQQFVFYALDDSIQQEWGVGQLVVGAPSTIIRPAVVMGNSAGTTARLNFASATRCYTALPADAAMGAVGERTPKNLLHNSMDRVSQRGLASLTVGGYFLDRWLIDAGAAGGTRTLTRISLTDADRTAIGDDEADFAQQYVFSGGAAAGDYDVFMQRIEGLRRTANKSLTYSFWAKAATGTPKIGVNLAQVFGTGGSPSATLWNTAQSVTISTTWTRYSLTFAVPSLVGKTLGTTVNTDFLQAALWMSSGATNNATAGAIGVQAAGITTFGRQLEVGAFPSPLEKQDIRFDLANCQRFYNTVQTYVGPAASYNTCYSFPVRMRATPAIAGGGAGYGTTALDANNVVHTQTPSGVQTLTFTADL